MAFIIFIMINIEIRDKNRIITLSSPTKTPIRSRSGSPYFYNSMELLCVALGSCFGKELVQLCSNKNINPRVFESIYITMENFIPKIIISHPKEMDNNILNDIKTLAHTCQVAKLLRNRVDIEFTTNKISTDELIDESKKGCCGGN